MALLRPETLKCPISQRFLGQNSRSITWESDLAMRREYYPKRLTKQDQRVNPNAIVSRYIVFE